MATDDTSRQDNTGATPEVVTACPSCGVQLLPDGTVDAIDDEPDSAKHYADCTAVGDNDAGRDWRL